MAGDAFTVGILFFLGFLALAGAGLTLLRFWLVEGTLDGTVGLGILGGMLFFSVVAIKTSSPLIIFLWILCLVAGTVALPWLAAIGEKGQLNALREEEIAKYRRALESNPRNYVAWRKIGEVYMKMNRYDEAIDAYKHAIQLDPPDAQKLRRRLNQAIEYRAGWPTADIMVCDHCHQETPKAPTCLYCGAKLELTFLDWILRRETLRSVLRPMAIVAAGAVATGTIFMTLPLAVKIAVMLIMSAVGAVLIWQMTHDA